jgi:hypothetical protein
MPTFVSHGSGPTLIRTTAASGRTIQIKSGHGYYRSHTSPSGKVTDLRKSGLTPDEIEAAIVGDIDSHLQGGGGFPKPGPGFTGPAIRSINVKSVNIEFRAVESPGGVIDVPTYYEK